MKKLISFYIVILIATPIFAQENTLSIEDCVEAATRNSGMAGFDQGYAEVSEIIDAIGKSYNMPTLQLKGQYTYQSDVVSFPDNPLFPGPDIPKNQGRLYLETGYVLYNGGKAVHKTAMEKQNVEIKKKGWNIEMENLSDQVRELYFALFLSRKQIGILKNTMDETQRQRETVAVWVENGIKSKIDLNKFDLLLFRQEKAIVGAEYNENTISGQLGSLTGLDISAFELLLPEESWPSIPAEINNNSLQLINLQKNNLELHSNLLKSDRMPMIAAFLQAGVGQPNPMNFFSTDVSGYYLGGVRLNWTIWDYGRTSRQLRINQVYNDQLLTKRIFLSENVRRQYNSNNMKYSEYLFMQELEHKELDLQEEIVEISLQQFEEGIIPSSQYLDEKTRLDLLMIQEELRDIQLQKLIYETHQLLK